MLAFRSFSRTARKMAGPLTAVGLCAAVAGLLAQSASPAASNWRLPAGKDFPLAGGDWGNRRYSALDKVDTSNIKKLGGAWSVHLENGKNTYNMEATPVVVDGVMYVSTGHQNVVALNAKTGEVKWKYEPGSQVPTGANRGVVVAEGKVFYGRRDNTLVALDQQTGQLVWQTKLTDQRPAYTAAPPVYYDGLVYIGIAGGEQGVRGHMGAYDAKTGREVWKFWTIPGPGQPGAETWEGDSYKYGGAGIWTQAAIDPDLGMLYVGTGNAGPDTDGRNRGGDNLYTCSVLALDLKTGAYKWHFQEIHHDIWDQDSASAPLLADITYRGRARKIVMHAGKTGYLYIFDRTDGKPLVGIEEKLVKQEARMKTAKTQPFPVGDPFVPMCAEPVAGYETGCLFSAFWDTPVLIFPGSSGGNAFAPLTFSPKTNLVYIPASVMATLYTSKHEAWDETKQGFVKTGGGEGFFRPAGTPRSGTLTAMDPSTNKIVWQKTTKYPMGGGSGLLSTAGGLLFHGESDGNLVAYDIKNGDELWKFQTGAGANAPVMTYEIDGEQYVAVLSGGNNLLFSQRGDSMWAFKLGGTLPEAPAAREPPVLQPGRATAQPQ